MYTYLHTYIFVYTYMYTNMCINSYIHQFIVEETPLQCERMPFLQYPFCHLFS